MGLIIGLVVGLGIALAVALYVTKAPVPFVDRGVQRPNTSDAVEAERAKDWDPNQGLGRPPAAATPADPLSAITGAVPGPTPAPSDAIGQLIQKTTEGATPGAPAAPAPAEATNAPDPFIYYVQAGAYRSPEEANAQRARMAMAGFETQVSEREQGGRQVYRVRMGPYNNRTDAESVEQQLRAQGFDTALVRVQR